MQEWRGFLLLKFKSFKYIFQKRYFNIALGEYDDEEDDENNYL